MIMIIGRIQTGAMGLLLQWGSEEEDDEGGYCGRCRGNVAMVAELQLHRFTWCRDELSL